jgi:hypothetical protein
VSSDQQKLAAAVALLIYVLVYSFAYERGAKGNRGYIRSEAVHIGDPCGEHGAQGAITIDSHGGFCEQIDRSCVASIPASIDGDSQEYKDKLRECADDEARCLAANRGKP